MQKMETVSNIRLAMQELFGVGAAPAAKETERIKPGAIAVAEAEAMAAAPAMRSACAVQGGSFLSAGTVWEGRLRAEGDVEIAGEFHGDIATHGCATLYSAVWGNVAADIVTINREASIIGSVTAREVRCAGQIEGDLIVSDSILLEPTACVRGNIRTDSLCVAQGAVICGEVDIA